MTTPPSPGLPSNWVAVWIEPDEHGGGDVQRPAYHLAIDFTVDTGIRAATLFITAHGLYEAFVNGQRVGDDELLPGFTAFRQRLRVQAHDVTALLSQGTNCMGALLSDGWWRGQHSSARRTNSYGATTALFAELHLSLTTGETRVIATDGAWRSTPSHVLAADLIAGEVHDLRRRVAGWSEPGADRGAWDDVRVASHPVDVLCETTGPPVRRIQELSAVSVTDLAPGRHLVDFGQNSNGWIRLTDLGPRGTTLRIVYGEALDAHGDVTQDNVSHADKWPDRAFQTDVVISDGSGAAFEPRHSTKGFRYVRVEGHPGPLDVESITSVVVHSVLRRVGDFSCSDERLNRLHAAADWSFRGNACGIPTDCPTRERAAWTGDYQTFIATAAYLYDVTDFTTSWLLDVAAEQRADGCVLNVVPDPHDLDLAENAMWLFAQGSAGWGDAACHVPWELYLATGRTEVIRPMLGVMRRWVDFAADRAAAGRHPNRVEARPEPLGHERFLWDTGFHFGEWSEPGSAADPEGALERVLSMDHGPTATAFLFRSASELAQAASVVGDEHVSHRYRELAAAVRAAWRAEFIDTDGRVQPQTQANLVRALAFDLVPEALAQRAADDLAALIRAAGTHLGTGFLATPFLLPVLADHGYLDVAYELLFQDTAPSWLLMIDRGSTTIWEAWDDESAQLTGSLNHYSKGAVISFLHRYVAGLHYLEPGYRRFRVAPRPGGGITSARTHHDTPFGRIDVSWAIEAGQGAVEVTVPEGCQGVLALPDGTSSYPLGAGKHQHAWVEASPPRPPGAGRGPSSELT